MVFFTYHSVTSTLEGYHASQIFSDSLNLLVIITQRAICVISNKGNDNLEQFLARFYFSHWYHVATNASHCSGRLREGL